MRMFNCVFIMLIHICSIISLPYASANFPDQLSPLIIERHLRCPIKSHVKQLFQLMCIITLRKLAHTLYREFSAVKIEKKKRKKKKKKKKKR